MNFRTTLALVALLGLPALTFAQTYPPVATLPLQGQTIVPSYHLGVGYQKTTHLVFPFPVAYVDLGSADIIADKAQNAENIVKVKANVIGFAQTNMTVLTTDGKLYSFLVDFEKDPRVINVNFTGIAPSLNNPAAGSLNKNMVQFTNVDLTENQLMSYCAAILEKKRMVRGHDEKKDNITLGLRGMYTKDDAFFFQLYLFNSSNISYDIDFIKFTVRDKKLMKRTAVQESQISPIYVYNGERGTIPGAAMIEKVFAFHKFTIPEDKVLVVEMFERGGGRQLSLKLSNKDILQARRLKDVGPKTQVTQVSPAQPLSSN